MSDEKTIQETIEEAFAPVKEQIEELMKSKTSEPPAEPGSDLSKGVQDWIEDQRTDRLGGKDLRGPTSHNPHPKVKEPGPTHDSLGKLTGKMI